MLWYCNSAADDVDDDDDDDSGRVQDGFVADCWHEFPILDCEVFVIDRVSERICDEVSNLVIDKSRVI